MPKLYKSAKTYIIKETNFSNVQEMELVMGEVLEVNIEVVDKRKISNNQRALIFAICKDIENYTGTESEIVRYSAMEHCNVKSLRMCSVAQANKIISELIDFILINQIPISLKTRNSEAFSFEEKHMYMLILSRTCIITGKRADIHHIDRIGLGGNRQTMSHIGKRVLPLCREKHNEIHEIGDEAFMKKYNIDENTIVKVDERIEKFIKTGKIQFFKEDDENER